VEEGDGKVSAVEALRNSYSDVDVRRRGGSIGGGAHGAGPGSETMALLGSEFIYFIPLHFVRILLTI
jgi:hypothetical protein